MEENRGWEKLLLWLFLTGRPFFLLLKHMARKRELARILLREIRVSTTGFASSH